MRIAQLSDLHLTGDGSLLYGRVNTWAAFAAALLRLANLERRPDWLVLTGDLADEGDVATYRRMADRLGELGIPYGLIPGNHDNRENLRTAVCVGSAVGACHQRFELGEGDLLLLDTLVPGREWGAVTPAHIAWLETVVVPGRSALLALHHPPFLVGIRGMDAIRCRGGELLAEWLVDRPEVEALCCGHVHRFVVATFAGRRAFTAPSTAHQIALADGPLAWAEEPGGFLLHDWEPGKTLVTHYVPVAAATTHRYGD